MNQRRTAVKSLTDRIRIGLVRFPGSNCDADCIDALERAFVDYEPLHVPSSFFLFAPEDSHLEQRPSIGAIMETARFCRLGAFTLEPYTRP